MNIKTIILTFLLMVTSIMVNSSEPYEKNSPKKAPIQRWCPVMVLAKSLLIMKEQHI